MEKIFDFLCKIRKINSKKHFYISEASSHTKINYAFASLLAHPLIRKDQANVWASLLTEKEDQQSREEIMKSENISKSQSVSNKL